jgi:hypothetical protein
MKDLHAPIVKLPTQLSQSLIEKRCYDCDPGPYAERVLATAVTNTTRCDRCQRLLFSREHFWAVLAS